jgi:hypothetical protein
MKGQGKMKRIANRLMMMLALVALASALVVAKGKSEDLTLPQDVMINGTLVKKGDYKLKFDEQTGELLILKGKRVVARTSASIEKREKEAARTEFGMMQQGEAKALRSITFRGDRETIVMHEATGGTETPTAVAPAKSNSNP